MQTSTHNRYTIRLFLVAALYAFLMAYLTACAPLSDPEGLFMRETVRTAIESANMGGPW